MQIGRLVAVVVPRVVRISLSLLLPVDPNGHVCHEDKN